MKTVEITDARDSLATYAEHRKDFPIVVTDHGRPVAALLALDNTDVETASLSANPQFISLIDRSRRHHAQKGGISSREMRKRLEPGT